MWHKACNNSDEKEKLLVNLQHLESFILLVALDAKTLWHKRLGHVHNARLLNLKKK
uniref:GAG-pre-integrase domain-containing protein n=1 Tax=Rhizophora mucronata TaxID=61149 RepID=A0A2P2NIN9_RHIMU